jgi:hypothetical protein
MRLSNRGFLALFACTFAFMAVAITALNYGIDAEGFVRNSDDNVFERRMAEGLATHQAVVIEKPFNEDSFKYYLATHSAPADIVVIGSSRGYQISSEFLGKPLMNYSVGAAGLRDLLALSDLSQEKGDSRVLIMEVDPWVFNRNHPKAMSPLLYASYARGLRSVGRQPRTMEFIRYLKTRFAVLIDFNETGKSMENLYWKLFKDDADNGFHFQEDFAPNEHLVSRDDGSFIYDRAIRDASPSYVARLAARFNERIREDNYFEKGFVFSEENFDTFVAYVRKMAAHRKVVLVLAPVHPLVYDAIARRTHNFFLGEERLKQAAFPASVFLIGSYSAQAVGCGPDEFFDHLHPRASCLAKIFATLSPAAL